jgi:hypothetical protein
LRQQPSGQQQQQPSSSSGQRSTSQHTRTTRRGTQQRQQRQVPAPEAAEGRRRGPPHEQSAQHSVTALPRPQQPAPLTVPAQAAHHQPARWVTTAMSQRPSDGAPAGSDSPPGRGWLAAPAQPKSSAARPGPAGKGSLVTARPPASCGQPITACQQPLTTAATAIGLPSPPLCT